MGNVGTKICQGCNNNICGDGKSYGESDLTNNNNKIPISNTSNPFFFNNDSNVITRNQKLNNGNNENSLNNYNKVESYVTSMNSHLPPEEEQKKFQLYSKNDNTINNMDNIDNTNNNDNYNNNYNNDYNNNYNNNSLDNSNSNEFSLKGEGENIEEISAKKITKLFRKFLNAKKLSHQNIVQEYSNISSSEYIIGLNHEELTVNLAPEENCLYLGTKFNNQKDGIGLEKFENSNAIYFGCFRNGKRVSLGKFKISNQMAEYNYRGEVKGIYAMGYGIFFDQKKYREYEGFFENSMKSGFGIEKYQDNSEYRGCYLNGKREGLGIYTWNDNSFYEGEWKNGKFHGYGIYQFPDGSEYQGEWKKGKFNGFGEFTYPENKKYFGFFKHDKRAGFGFEVMLNCKKAFIGFWKNNDMNGLGKFIINGKKKYGVYQEGKLMETINKKDFFKRIKEQNNEYLNFFKLDTYRSVLNLINGENEEE